MAVLVLFINICAIFNCIAFKLILFFNSATSHTRKTLCASATDLHLIKLHRIRENKNHPTHHYQLQVYG